MTENESDIGQKGAISASWERCERTHRLAQNALRPILRLQSSEVRPRSEELVERTGGRLGIFKQVADIAVRAGHCFSVADADGVLVRHEGKAAQQSEYESNGISLGSCWDERIAGTNGVSMAIAQQRAFTVRGQEHYFSKLRPFSCTGAPLYDAENQMIGVINLATVDKGNAADYMFAKQLLGVASDRIQRVLFERHFSEAMLVNISSPATGDVLRNSEILAVDETGLIIGSTTAAHELIGLGATIDLVGHSFADLFGADSFTLDRIPEHAPYVRTGDGQIVRLSRHLSDRKFFPGRGWRKSPVADQARPLSPAPSLSDITLGSSQISDQITKAKAYLDRAIPFVVQGESGTGKTALLAALHASKDLAKSEVLTIDCAALGDHEQDRTYIKTIFQQARIVDLLGSAEKDHLTLILDNVDELPKFAQAALRSLLQESEDRSAKAGAGFVVIATTRKPLSSAVQNGAFRDDLYYLLANAIIVVPPVQQRADLEVLTQALADRLADHAIDIAPEAMDAIRSYPWPGNVRELRSALQQALMEGDGQRISLVDLQSSPIFDPNTKNTLVVAAQDWPVHALSYSEEDQIRDALSSTRWNVSQAARKLGIGRATIHRKMKLFNISRPS
ncbi:MAG: sigma 54-interacting transcriptional regulator [Pseudomonadota bacterium]